MADRDLTVHLKADDKLTPAAKKAADALEKLERKPVEVEIDADVSSALRQLEDLTMEAQATAVAAEELGRALGPELAAKANLTGLVGDLKALGVTTEAVTANADEMAAKLKEAAAADVGGKLGANLGTARGATDQLADSARGANSALANMVGNTAQDVGALGGLAGSAGVAIGQMAEYASDAALGGEKLGSALGSMAKVAGPMAALGLAVSYFSKQLADAKAIDAFNADQVKQYTNAIRDGTGMVQAMREELEETQELVFKDVEKGPFGLANKKWSDDVSDNLAAVNMSLEEFQGLIDATEGEQAEWIAGMIRAGAEEGVLIDIMRAVVIARENQADATKTAAINEELLGDAVEETVKSTTKWTRAGKDANNALVAQVNATYAAQQAMKTYSDTVATADFGQAELAGGLAGMSAFTDQLFALGNIAQASETAISTLTAGVAEGGLTFDVATEAGRKNQDALEGVARTIDTQLAAAYDAADGDMSTFKKSAEVISLTTLGRLQTEMGLSAEETQVLGEQLGLLPADIETRYKLSGDEEAKLKLGLLQASIDDLPDSVETKVNQQIIMGDYQGALSTINSYYARNPATLPVKVVLGSSYPKGYNPVTGTIDIRAAPDAATMATTTATAVPTGPAASMAPITLKVPAPSITINAAVVGNRFDVERTVTRALRNYERVNGRRP